MNKRENRELEIENLLATIDWYESEIKKLKKKLKEMGIEI